MLDRIGGNSAGGLNHNSINTNIGHYGSILQHFKLYNTTLSTQI